MKNTYIERLVNASDIAELNTILTELMSNKTIHEAIKDDNLQKIIDVILEKVTDGDRLLAVAALGRLAAVSRTREAAVLANLPNLINDELPSIETLNDGDEKYYAAMALSNYESEWSIEYAIQESLNTESAEKARKVFLRTALQSSGDIENLFSAISEKCSELRKIDDIDKRAKKIRRIMQSLTEVINEWSGDCGDIPCETLNELFKKTVTISLKKADDEILYDISDSYLSLLHRLIEKRFSFAFKSETYLVLGSIKGIISLSRWSAFIGRSQKINQLKTTLLEAILVLSRQSRTDNEFLKPFVNIFPSKNSASDSLRKFLSGHSDLEPDIKEWWVNLGDIRKDNNKPQHKIGTSEDKQIGTLLIEVESAKESMEKLERAVVPFLEISDPVLASTVKKSFASYLSISRITKQLARIRKLSKTNLKGKTMEYNPEIHEILGGSQQGIRTVLVVRDGIQKEFAGSIKTLVKSWVQPEA